MTMIEQVARALCIEENGNPDAIMRDIGDPEWTWYITPAQRAIEAMRVPTQRVLDAGYAGQIHDSLTPWQAMIDAALAERESS